jgi:hypothetical protein
MRHGEPFSVKEHILIWVTLVLMLAVPLGLMAYTDYCQSTAQRANLARRAR